MYEVKPEIGRSLLPIPCLPVKTLKADTANGETTPAVIAEENKGMADLISVSDVSSEISFTIMPRRAPVLAPRKTRSGTPVAGWMAETVPISEKEHSVNKTVEQVVLEDSSGALEQGTQELTNSVINNSVLGEESDCNISESQTGLESDHTILSGGGGGNGQWNCSQNSCASRDI